MVKEPCVTPRLNRPTSPQQRNFLANYLSTPENLTKGSRTNHRPRLPTHSRYSLIRSLSVTSSQRTTWGFVGLGQMGYPMAKNLRAKIPTSDTVIIYDLNANATRRFVEEIGIVTSTASTGDKNIRIHIASSPREVAERAETIFTVLPEPQHVKDVFYDIIDSALPSKELKQQRLFIDCSTIDPVTSKEVAHAVQSRGQGLFVDAPMSGGVVGARAGTLTFMVGCPDSLVDRVKPYLCYMGSRVLHMGEQGAGLSAKLANNYLLALSNIATAEAMNLGIKWGLDKKRLGEMINACSGRCWSSEVNNPVPGVIENAPASRNYAGGFGVSLMRKDLKLAMAAAKEAGARLELADKAREVYEAIEKDEDYKGKDFSIVYRYLTER
ncbi:3-hydroxyisobutyrate dehydrogenase [Xylona heveae TC161]|uniref:3-hydroxyisobutyrate dehydrogenase n=1 Tax=Xylona heveae (strain CBS 132557 / TC161) TaxID=1328760 RepID=A0A165H9R4_XYLHT|nr:3-hydroxyisobutyrate dehydrogenase [Xylona heveae TC161]KZF23184.1 3-hydroxyisobutyrate dehydrogenase [Xylona heveae TC161]